jgi:hypothetical protein
MNNLKTLPEGQPIYVNGFFYVKSSKPIEGNDVVFDRRDGILKRVISVSVISDLVVLDRGSDGMEAIDKDNVYKLQHINPQDN